MKVQISKKIAGMTLQELRSDYKNRIFNQFLPFWDKGGYDRDHGGFMCELNDDGSVQNEEKNIWYQGRGIWVYSFLYNNFGKGKKYIEIAEKTRNFTLEHMNPADGKWLESVDRRGNPIVSTVGQGSEKDVYGALFMAAGLIELYKATKNEDDLKLAILSIWSSVKRYEETGYEGVVINGEGQKGLRTQGHSFMIVWILTNLLSFHSDSYLEKLQVEHVNHLMNDFWNSKYGIVNELLYHDYSRIPEYESVMLTGHSLEALWMVMDESIRKNDNILFELCKNRIRRLIEMNWDYVFDGLCNENYYVFGTDGKCPGPTYDLKVMWAQCEMLIATIMILEHSGEKWAQEWYERCRKYCTDTFIKTSNGVWIQAADRSGKEKLRKGESIYRKDNFHPIRYLMMNYLSIDRMIKNVRK